MADKDITQIHVSNFTVSIVGLKQALEELGKEYAAGTDEEVGAVMLQRLEKDNYIPARARDSYGRAFTREFRKFLGQPYTDDTPRGLDIKVLGAGCAQCDHLTQLVMEVLTELSLPAGVEHVTDVREIARYGVMGVPALLINRKVVATGSVPPKERIKRWLSEANDLLSRKA